MAEQWYYRMFGEQFGPMPLEGLKELAENGTIQALDQVRSSSSGTWVDAASVDALGLSTSERGNLAVATSISDFEISAPQSTSNDEWFCLLGDHELGPLSFDELLKFAEQEQLSADDQVKLGSNGKWRRAGSIGRLMAALPYIAHEKKIVPAPQKPAAERAKKSDPSQSTIPVPVAPLPTPTPVVVPDPELTYRLAYEQAKAKVMESMLAQADATYKAAEEQAQAQIAWASAPNVEKFWWGWSGGVEFGPVEFSQVFGLAKIGQLKPSDFVRNGQFAQYVPSSSVPGLYQAIEMISRASAARELARSQAQAAASLAAPPEPIDPAKLVKPVEPPAPAPAPAPTPAPVAAKPKSDPVIPLMRTSDPQISTRAAAPVEPAPIPEPEPEPQQRSYSGSTSGGYSSMGSGGYSSMGGMGGGYSSTSTMSTYGMNRPAPTPAKSYPKKSSSSSSSGSSWFSDMLESFNFKDPKTLGTIALVAFIGLILGWGYLPKSRGADVAKYKALKQLLEEVQQKRSNPSELAALQQKMTKMGKEMAAELKDKASPHEPAKQCLLWATRDEIPRMLNAGLNAESVHEKNFASKLKEAAIELGLEKRPPVDMAALAARANQD